MTDLRAPSVRAWTTYDLPVPVAQLRSWLVQDPSIPDLFAQQAKRHGNKVAVRVGDESVTYGQLQDQIGRASCRERVCQYVLISVCAVSLNKKKTNKLVT